MKCRPSAVLTARISGLRQLRVDLEQPRDLVTIASTARREEVGNAGLLPALDLRLESAPAGETVLPGDREQRIRELRARIGAPQILQTAPGLALQVLGRGTIGKL